MMRLKKNWTINRILTLREAEVADKISDIFTARLHRMKGQTPNLTKKVCLIPPSPCRDQVGVGSLTCNRSGTAGGRARKKTTPDTVARTVKVRKTVW